MKMKGFTFDEMPGGLLKSCCVVTESVRRASDSESAIRHSCWVLDYTLTGGLVDCRTDGADPGVRGTNVAHLYPPGRTYYERAMFTGVLSSAWILFDGEYPFLRELLENPGGFLRIPDPEGILRHFLLEMAEWASQGNRRYWKCHAEFCGILDCLGGLVPEKGGDGYTFRLSADPAGKGTETLQERVKAFLEKHYREKITLRRMAAELGFSVSSLAHRYRVETGETIMDALLRIRLRQALALLQPGRPLKAAAESAGFCNEFYFSRQFKRLFGCSPGEWRRKHSGN